MLLSRTKFRRPPELVSGRKESPGMGQRAYMEHNLETRLGIAVIAVLYRTVRMKSFYSYLRLPPSIAPSTLPTPLHPSSTSKSISSLISIVGTSRQRRSPLPRFLTHYRRSSTLPHLFTLVLVLLDRCSRQSSVFHASIFPVSTLIFFHSAFVPISVTVNTSARYTYTYASSIPLRTRPSDVLA